MLTLPIVLASLVACGPSTIVVQSDQPGCEDYDFENPPEDGVVVVDEPLALIVYRVAVIEACDAVFEPEFESDRTKITVREFWVDGTEGGCEACFSPTLTLKDPPPGKYEFRWYEGGADAPIDSLNHVVD